MLSIPHMDTSNAFDFIRNKISLPKVLASLATPWIQAEGAEPLVDGHRHRSHIQWGENGDPKLGWERQQER